MSALLEDLEAMRVKLDAAIRWNFGVIGSDPICNQRMEDVNRLEDVLRVTQPDEYAEYKNRYY
jgi:hypothetical protein